MTLQATDLIVINRGGVNYEVTGAEVNTPGSLLSTDLLMVQRDAELYQVSVGEVQTGNRTFRPNDFILVQRGDELFRQKPLQLPAFAPFILLNWDTTGLADGDTALAFKWNRAAPFGEVNPQYRIGSTGDPVFLDANGNFQIKVSSLPTTTGTMIILGYYSFMSFVNSSALVSVGEPIAGTIAAMIVNPTTDSGYQMFKSCSKLTSIPLDIPFRMMNSTFNRCAVFNQDISAMDVSKVKDFRDLFVSCPLFNQDISSWDMSSATEIGRMFRSCETFNQDLSAWGPQLAGVTDAAQVFQFCYALNSPLNNWDLSKCTSYNMREMFDWTAVFNQDLTSWCVTSATEEPNRFAPQSALDPANYPVWGTCP